VSLLRGVRIGVKGDINVVERDEEERPVK